MSILKSLPFRVFRKWKDLYHLRPKSHHKKGVKNIAIITGQLSAGGVERVLLNILEGLPKERFNVTIYVTDFNNNTWMDRFEKISTVLHLNTLLETHDEGHVKNYLVLSLITSRPDIIFITNSSSGYASLRQSIPLLRLIKRPKVYDLLHTHGRSDDNDAFLRISFPFDKFITKRIVISNYLKEYLANNYSISRDKIQVIYNGIKKSRPVLDVSSGEKDLEIKKGEKSITYIGRLQPDKSPLRIIEVARRLKDTLRKYSFVFTIVGQGELREDMVNLARRYSLDESTIRFVGYHDNPTNAMAASHFTILTSDLEGLPMSIIESMQVGTPAIAPAVGGIPEIITDSKSGFLAHFDDAKDEKSKIESLVHAVESAILLPNDELLAMKERAMLDIEEHFTNMESEYLDLFSEK